MLVTDLNEAREFYLGKDASVQDSYIFFFVFAAGKKIALHENIEQRDIDAHLAFQAIGWSWPFEIPSNAIFLED